VRQIVSEERSIRQDLDYKIAQLRDHEVPNLWQQIQERDQRPGGNPRRRPPEANPQADRMAPVQAMKTLEQRCSTIEQDLSALSSATEVSRTSASKVDDLSRKVEELERKHQTTEAARFALAGPTHLQGPYTARSASARGARSARSARSSRSGSPECLRAPLSVRQPSAPVQMSTAVHPVSVVTTSCSSTDVMRPDVRLGTTVHRVVSPPMRARTTLVNPAQMMPRTPQVPLSRTATADGLTRVSGLLAPSAVDAARLIDWGSETPPLQVGFGSVNLPMPQFLAVQAAKQLPPQQFSPHERTRSSLAALPG